LAQGFHLPKGHERGILHAGESFIGRTRARFRDTGQYLGEQRNETASRLLDSLETSLKSQLFRNRAGAGH
jgi:hypothetical protein